MLIGKKLKDYPLNCLVKHYDKPELVAKHNVPKEWYDLTIVHTYTYENQFGKEKVLVIK